MFNPVYPVVLIGGETLALLGRLIISSDRDATPFLPPAIAGACCVGPIFSVGSGVTAGGCTITTGCGGGGAGMGGIGGGAEFPPPRHIGLSFHIFR